MVRIYKKKSTRYEDRCAQVSAKMLWMTFCKGCHCAELPNLLIFQKTLGGNNTHFCMILNLFSALDKLMLCPNDMRPNLPRSRGRLGHFGWVSVTINYK